MKAISSENGAINVLLIPLILSVLFFFAALGFGVWAYMEREDYKYNTDQKVDEAVAVAVERAETEKENEFIEREKEPLRKLQGPQAFGSFTVEYPKTWSVYMDESAGDEILAYFHPRYVSADRKGESTAHALSLEVLNEQYDEVVSDYDKFISNGEAKARPYSIPNKKDITGLRVDGKISEDHRGAVVMMPLRDKTIVLKTMSEQFVGDFNNIILKNFDFIP